MRNQITALHGLLSFSLIGMLLQGCTPGTSGKEGQEGKASGLENRPKTISIAINGQSSTFPPGLDENNNPYLDYMKKNTGLDIRVMIPPCERLCR